MTLTPERSTRPQLRIVFRAPQRVSTAVALTLLSACSDTPAANRNATVQIEALNVRECARQLRVVLIQDQTASSAENVTPQTTRADLEPVVDRVIQCGGEIGIGLLTAHSNRPLLRFAVSRPAAMPKLVAVKGSVFERDKKNRLNQQMVGKYRTVDSARTTEARARAETFLDSAVALLRRPADAKRSDVWGAIARLSTFGGEPNSDSAARLFGLVVSDSQDNQKASRVALPSGMELVLVNSMPVQGSLDAFSPHRFESVEAAIRWILSNSR